MMMMMMKKKNKKKHMWLQGASVAEAAALRPSHIKVCSDRQVTD